MTDWDNLQIRKIDLAGGPDWVSVMEFTNSGYTGFTGFTGEPGSNSGTGSTGDTGFTGFTGFTGEPGSNSGTGSTGDTGVTGFTGFTGFTGEPGSNSGTGATGPTGYTDYNTLNANINISGGGTVTWSGLAVSWSDRVIVMNQNSEFATSGYFNIGQHTQLLNDWEALYYVPTFNTGPDFNPNLLRVIGAPSSNNEIKAHWIFICSRNDDLGTLRWNPGYVTIPAGGTYNSATGACSWLQSSVYSLVGDTGIWGETPPTSLSNAIQRIAEALFTTLESPAHI